jgi:YD repeat-containing protein
LANWHRKTPSLDLATVRTVITIHVLWRRKTLCAHCVVGIASAVTNGLLQQSVDPRGGLHAYQFDPAGRLTRAEAPGGQAYTLNQSLIPGGRKVTMTTPEGRAREYAVSNSSNETETVSAKTPSGLQATT